MMAVFFAYLIHIFFMSWTKLELEGRKEGGSEWREKI